MNDDIRIVWWNVNFLKCMRNTAYIIKFLEEYGDFDVICLQEYVEGGDTKIQKWLEDNNYAIQYMPFNHQGKYSQGVMTAVKEVHSAKQDSHVLRRDGPIMRRPWPNIRGMISTKLKINGGGITVFNFHSTKVRRHTRDMRKREFNAMKKILDAESKNNKWVLGGDFNFFGRDWRRHYLRERYSFQTGTTVKKTWRLWFDLSPVRLNIDYVVWDNLASDPEFNMGPFCGSDHRPLIVEIERKEFSTKSY